MERKADIRLPADCEHRPANAIVCGAYALLYRKVKYHVDIKQDALICANMCQVDNVENC